MVVHGDVELKLMVGAIKSVSESFHVDQKIVRHQQALVNFNNPDIKSLISSPKKKGNSGCPQQWICQVVRDAVSLLPLNQRRTIRSIASSLEILNSSVLRMRRDLKDVVIMPIALQPLLADVHKVQHVLFAVTKLNKVNNHFHPFCACVHVDEKWCRKDMLRIKII
jgi:hypothetical protein